MLDQSLGWRVLPARGQPRLTEVTEPHPPRENSAESQELFWAESLLLSQLPELPGQSSSAPTRLYSLKGPVPRDLPQGHGNQESKGPWNSGGATPPTRDVADEENILDRDNSPLGHIRIPVTRWQRKLSSALLREGLYFSSPN